MCFRLISVCPLKRYGVLLLKLNFSSCSYGIFIFLFCSERALLNRLMIELYKLDSDVMVGHNISGFDLDVLLHRAQVGTFFSMLFFFNQKNLIISIIHVLY